MIFPEDVNDAERLARDPAMRAIVGREGMDRLAASTSQMGRFETEWLASEANLAALTELSGAWIDRVHRLRPPDGIILNMDSSESQTHGQQEGRAQLDALCVDTTKPMAKHVSQAIDGLLTWIYSSPKVWSTGFPAVDKSI